MAVNNQGKWKEYQDAQILYGDPGSGQNLNADLQQNLADELDQIIAAIMGSGAVDTGWVVSASTGLAVNIGAGSGYIDGQRLRNTANVLVSALPSSTSGIKIYATAGTPFSPALKAWPVNGGFTTGSLSAGQLLLALVDTDGDSVTLVTDQRVLISQLINVPSAGQKAALVGSSGTPGAGNTYVTEADERVTAQVTRSRIASFAVI